MVVQPLLELSPTTAITAVVTSASVTAFRAWTWLQRSTAAERARTRRLTTALRGDFGQDHAEVVRACAELEAAIGSVTSPLPMPMRRPLGRRARLPRSTDH
jgi:hypothetical protein